MERVTKSMYCEVCAKKMECPADKTCSCAQFVSTVKLRSGKK